jgi:Uma2 family endonuclease
MVLAQRPLTLEEFLQLPEEKPALEYLDGEVTRKMSPLGPHGRLQGRLYLRFELFGLERRLASAFPETRVTFGGASFVPDLIVYRWERIPSDERGDVPSYFYEPPDIAVEIASPGQTPEALAERCRWYVEHGVRVALLVLPRTRSARVFRAGTELGPLRGADRIDLGDVLPGFELAVDELFGALRARPD